MNTSSEISTYNFYKQYHQHPTNKAIHFICIPMIIFSIFNYLSIIKPNLKLVNDYYINKFLNNHLTYITLSTFYFIYYTLYMNSIIAFVMSVYFFYLYLFSFIFVHSNKNWIIDTTYIFIFSWVLQFIGHYIEGSRPALTDSLSQAFLEAPVFSLDYLSLFSRLLKN